MGPGVASARSKLIPLLLNVHFDSIFSLLCNATIATIATLSNRVVTSLAYAEMRLILARLLWNFDLELAVPEDPKAKNDNWIEKQEVYIIWNKVPLMVNLRPVSR